MFKLDFADAVGIVGIALTVLLVVLDKAGKLKGGWLLILLCLAGVMTLFVAVGNGWVQDAPTKWKAWRTVFMLCVTGLSYSCLAIWIGVPTAEGEAESAKSANPVVQVSWKMLPLPITIPPHTTAAILLVREDARQEKIIEVLNVINNEDKSSQWPIKGKIWPPEQMRIFKFENQDKVGLFNLAIPISASFQMGENPPETIASAQTTYRIESLPSGQSTQLYAVNLTNYMVDVPMPTTAKLTIEGSRDRRDIKLTPYGMLAEIGPEFENAVLPLMPTEHRWVGTRPEPKEK